MRFLYLALAFGLTAGAQAQSSTARLAQLGSNHVAEITQAGASFADVSQDGRQDYVFLLQSGASSATITQVGAAPFGDHDNCVLLDQQSGSQATIRQTGAHNTVWGTSSVIGAPPYAYAASTASQLTVDQTGFANVLYLDQTDSVASAYALGRWNTSTIIQH